MDLNITMNKQGNIDEELQQSRKAKKFNLWLGMIGMFMMFAALSSGFIVYTASGVDKGIKTILPYAFMASTGVIILSSITMQLAYQAVKQGAINRQKMLLIATILLGVVFFFYNFTLGQYCLTVELLLSARMHHSRFCMCSPVCT